MSSPTKKAAVKTYPEDSYGSISLPRQSLPPLRQALDKAAHCFGAAEFSQSRPQRRSMEALTGIDYVGARKVGDVE
jgi:hypothetical protein